MSKRLLYLTAEEWPTFRVDVTTLFGQSLPAQGIQTDLVTEGTPQAAQHAWPAGDLKLCAQQTSKARNHIVKFTHLVREAWRAQPGQHSAIQVRDMPVVAALGLLAARRKGLPFFYWMSYPQSEGQQDRARTRGPSAGLRYWFPLLQGLVGEWLLYRWVMPRADHVFVQSAEMARYVSAKGIDAGKLTPVPMAVDPALADPAHIPPSDDARLRGREVVVYLGSLDAARQIDVLVEAMARVRAQRPQALLVLAGDADADDQKAHIRQLLAQPQHQGGVLWTGWKPMAEAWRYVRAAAVAVSPVPRGLLLDVSSPTKAVEYLALETPALVNDNPDQQALIEASQAGRCTPYTVADFAHAILEMLAMSPDERARMGHRGRAHVVAHRNYAHLGRELAQVYHRLLP